MTKDTFADCGCGGHAYLGSFDDLQDEPALVYNGGLATGSETVSHEVGHQLGLNHDGVGSTVYYRGHGSGDTGWGPIMGAPFSKRTTQWSNGDYFNASNTGQDDLAVITRSANFPYVSDDHADDRFSATPLKESATTEVGVFGIIEKNDDADWFRFTTGAGDVSFAIEVLSYKPNLDVWAGLFDSSGAFIADANPQTELSASFENVALQAGEYFIKIDGVPRDGTYNPLLDAIVEPDPPPYTVSGPQGYSDYGSLGQYRISGSIVDPGSATVSINASAETVVEGNDAEFTLTTSDGGSGDVTVEIRAVRQSAPGLPAPDSAEPADFSISTTQVVSIIDGTATLQVPVLDDTLIERNEFFEVQILDSGTYQVGDRAAGMEIIESKTSFSIFATEAVTVEGDSPDEQTHHFTVRRNGRADSSDVIGWQRSGAGDDPAQDDDFTTAASGTIVFAPGETSHVIEVGLAGDLQVEPDEAYSIALFIPEGQSFEIESSRASADGRIEDDESIISLASSAQYRVRQVRFDEGNFDHWAIDDFRITGTDLEDDFDPGVEPANWDRIENADLSTVFPGTDGNALFFTGDEPRAATTVPKSPPPGAKVEFSIVFADENGNGLNATENGEDAVLEYSIDGESWIEIQQFDESEYPTWTLQSVDLPPDATFNATAFDEGDSGTNVQSISISRTGFLDKPITVDWSVAPGTLNPVSADDFVGGFPQGTAGFDAGQVTVLIELPIVGETEIEPDESFVLTVANNSGGPIVNGTINGVILNDDFVAPEINVVGNNQLNVLDGDLLPSEEDGTDFGLAEVDSESLTNTFSIDNIGVLDLNVASVDIIGTHAEDFQVTQYPDSVIGPGASSPLQIAFDPSASGDREATVVINNDDPNESSYRFAISGQGTDLRVLSVEVNGGNASRSQLESVKVTFNQLVQHQMLYEAFQVRNLSGDQFIRSVFVTPVDVDEKTEATLMFNGQGSNGPTTLEDGNYELKVNAFAVWAAVDSSSSPYPLRDDFVFGSDGENVNATDAFFRFFGDIDGDRDVDGQDYGNFGLSFLQDSGSPQFNAQFDYEGDGDVDGQDYGHFGDRFLKTLEI